MDDGQSADSRINTPDKKSGIHSHVAHRMRGGYAGCKATRVTVEQSTPDLVLPTPVVHPTPLYVLWVAGLRHRRSRPNTNTKRELLLGAWTSLETRT